MIDSSEGRKRYVRELYTFLLGREPDAAEMEAWLNVLNMAAHGRKSFGDSWSRRNIIDKS